MSSQIGDRIDALGVRATLTDTDLVQSAVVVLSVVDEAGREQLKLAWSDGQSWVTRRGMLEVALDMERVPPVAEEED